MWVDVKTQPLCGRLTFFPRPVFRPKKNCKSRTKGILIDAKGPGYATFVYKGIFRDFFRGADELVDQAQRQLRAANGNPIRWHIAEEDAVTAIRNLFADRGITGIIIVLTPIAP